MHDLDRFAFSINEAAMRAGLGRDKLYAAVRVGELEARKAGRRTLITAEALPRRFTRSPVGDIPKVITRMRNPCWSRAGSPLR